MVAHVKGRLVLAASNVVCVVDGTLLPHRATSHKLRLLQINIKIAAHFKEFDTMKIMLK